MELRIITRILLLTDWFTCHIQTSQGTSCGAVSTFATANTVALGSVLLLWVSIQVDVYAIFRLQRIIDAQTTFSTPNNTQSLRPTLALASG